MFVIPHPIVRVIDSKRAFIHNLITLYPSFYDSWEKQYEEKRRKEIREIAEGDPNIESSMTPFSPIWEYEQDMRNIFYQAMVIEVYSFYESIILKLHQIEKIPGKTFVDLRKNKGFLLSEKANLDNEFVYNYIRILRHYIAHNIDAEPKDEHLSVLMELAKTEKGFYFEDGVLTITNDNILLKALDAEYNVLMELCDIFGYKSIRIP